MYQLFYLNQLKNVKGISHEVISHAKNVLTVLDENYGLDRNPNGDGGFVVLFTPQDESCALNDILGIDIEKLIPEYTETIITPDGDYICSLVLTNNEHSINIYMPRDKATPNLLDC